LAEETGGPSNHVLWIIGHLAGTRGHVVSLLTGRQEAPPVDRLFAGGIPIQPDEPFPAAPVVIEAWRAMAIRVAEAVNAERAIDLDAPSPKGVPSQWSGERRAGSLRFHASYLLGSSDT
jgi:hypothetical protein